MILKSRIPVFGSNLCRRPTRDFSLSKVAGNTPLDVQRRQVTVTRKKYTDLPVTFTHPDGTLAEPLVDWLGGLEDDSKECPSRLIVSALSDIVSKRSNHGAGVVNGVVQASDVVQAPRPISKHRKKRNKTTLAPSSDSPPVKRMSRRPVAPHAETDIDADETLYRQPRSGHQKNEFAMGPGANVAPLALPNTGSEETVVKKPSVPRQPRNQLALEILGNLSNFPHCILLTRVGQFYESYFDQAEEVARLLNIKLTRRTWDGQRVLMCGFPLVHIDRHLKTLVLKNKRAVAMCEEFPRSAGNGKTTFDRKVVRILTPGTLIDESFLNPYENNYLLAIYCNLSTEDEMRPSVPESLGLAWMDVSTGDFFVKASSAAELRDDLARISPREIVLVESLRLDASHFIRQTVAEEGSVVSYAIPETEDDEMQQNSVNTHSNRDIPALLVRPSVYTSPMVVFTVQESSAIRLLIAFLRSSLLEYMPQLQLLSPAQEGTSGRLHIDAPTIKALEIREGMREGGSTGSLLSVIKRTVTSSGTRLLSRWLCSPSTSLTEINARQSLVAFFHSRPHLRRDLAVYLEKSEDTLRIVQRFLLGRGDVGDLWTIGDTITVWASTKRRIELERRIETGESVSSVEREWSSVDTLISRMTDLDKLSQRILGALQPVGDLGPMSSSDADRGIGYPDPPSCDRGESARGGWTIRPQFSEHLRALRDMQKQLMIRRDSLEREFQVRYDAPSLTLRSSATHGMHVHIGRSKRDLAKLNIEASRFITIAESGSTKSFFNQEWFILGSQIIENNLAIKVAENEAFATLRNEVNGHTSSLRRNARILDELDVALGFANLAAEMNFVRPTMSTDTAYHVVNGRHPTVEFSLLTAGRVFTPNTISLTPESRLQIITGPNMGGKSTLLRQAALLTILAQTGSFVPADKAEMGIVDKLFSRVGAGDDLFRDRSTFMVEMLETADILRRATPRSFVIMDEVGRGTTVKDGLAIAFSTIHHLCHVNKCRALFATHFHELTDMLGYSDEPNHGVFRNVGFFCTDVEETDGHRFVYSHRLKPGVNRDSHGLKVAQLAGMPPSAMEIADNALNWMKQHDKASSVELRDLGERLATNSIDDKGIRSSRLHAKLLGSVSNQFS